MGRVARCDVNSRQAPGRLTQKCKTGFHDFGEHGHYRLGAISAIAVRFRAIYNAARGWSEPGVAQ